MCDIHDGKVCDEALYANAANAAQQRGEDLHVVEAVGRLCLEELEAGFPVPCQRCADDGSAEELALVCVRL